jgi:hypothetical protein
MRPYLFVLLTLLLTTTAPAAEVSVERVDIVGKGLYKVETGEQTPDPEVPTGSIALPLKFTNIEKTDMVPARVGVEFGFEYMIVGSPGGAEVPLEFGITYPEAGLPDPESPSPLHESNFQRNKPVGEVVYFGYGFENDWELVPGVWTFAITYQGRVLAEQEFTVVE